MVVERRWGARLVVPVKEGVVDFLVRWWGTKEEPGEELGPVGLDTVDTVDLAPSLWGRKPMVPPGVVFFFSFIGSTPMIEVLPLSVVSVMPADEDPVTGGFELPMAGDDIEEPPVDDPIRTGLDFPPFVVAS